MSKLKLKTIKEILSSKNGNASQKENEKEQDRQDYEAGEYAAKNGETCPTSASQKFKEGFKKREEETKNKKVNQKMKK